MVNYAEDCYLVVRVEICKYLKGLCAVANILQPNSRLYSIIRTPTMTPGVQAMNEFRSPTFCAAKASYCFISATVSLNRC